jgi:ElaB/YqjD/DUF883 family membrane-anchored ribosome-binding protein
MNDRHNSTEESSMEKPLTPEVAFAPGFDKSTSARIIDKVSDKVGQARQAVTDFGRRTVDNVDAQRRPVAATLEQTASTLHEQTDRVAGIAHATADGLHATADYVRENDLQAMSKGIGGLVRRYPAQSLIVAAMAGFCVARVMGKRSRS